MCISVCLLDGRRIDSMDQLAALVGRDAIAVDEDSDPLAIDRWIRSGSCLCGVDIVGTADRAGYVAFSPAYPDGDTMEWGMIPLAAAQGMLGLA